MLLQRLVEYAHRDGTFPPFHQERAFSWQLNLSRTGDLESTELQCLDQPDVKGKLIPSRHIVPDVQRSGTRIPPLLAADCADFVLGWSDKSSGKDRATERHREFIKLTNEWAESPAGCEDPVAQAVAAFVRSGQASEVRRRAEVTAKTRLLIAVAGVPAYKSPSIAAFWSSEVRRRKTAGNGLCLACGQNGPLLDTIPGSVPQNLVPGADNQAALVTVNEKVFGYGLTTKLGSSPLCANCGEATIAGLVRALSSGHSTTYKGQDSVMTWWTTEDSDTDLMQLVRQPSPEQVNALLASVHRGHAHGQRLNPGTFCSLTIGGNVARVMVRDWVEMPLSEFNCNIAAWFADHTIEPVERNGPHHHGLGQFARVSGRWIRNGERGRPDYASFGAKGADRPDGVYRDLTRAVLRGAPLPPSLLAHLVHRVRTDGHFDDARASLIRLFLTRHPSAKEKPLPNLDPDNTTPAYVAGRVFAVLEQIQHDASNSPLNTTYGDRFFSGAISNPRAALVSGRRDAIAWLRKLRNSAARKGAAVRHEKQLDELFGLLDAAGGIPSRTTLHEQSLFLLGYHHQRAHHFARARAYSATTAIAAKETD